MQKIAKQNSNSWRSPLILWGGLLCLCAFTNITMAQGDGGEPVESTTSGVNPAEPISQSKANQPTAIKQLQSKQTRTADDPELTTASALPANSEAAAVDADLNPTDAESGGKTAAEENIETASLRGQRLLPPDPRRQPADDSALGGESGANEGAAEQGVLNLDTPNWLLRGLGGLGVILAMLFLLRPILRKFAGPLGSARAPSGVIEALARYPFGKGQFLVLLKLDTRILLLCQTNQGSNLITEIDDPDEVAGLLRRVHDEKGESFNRKLEALLHHDRKTKPLVELPSSTTLESPALTSSFSAADPSEVIDLTGGSSAGWANRFRIPTLGRRAKSTTNGIATTMVEVK